MTGHTNHSSSNAEAIRAACISHAADLITAAERLQHDGFSNIAYHLAALALEEIGKARFAVVRNMALRRGEANPWYDKAMEDHTKKMLWALLTGALEHISIKRELFESLNKHAQDIHEKRLAGLYVNHNAEIAGLPKDAVKPDETERLIGFVKATLDLEHAKKRRELTPEEKDVQEWFIKIATDTTNRGFVFGSESMDKLAELGNAREWVLWLKNRFDQMEAEQQALLQQELQRPKPDGIEAEKDKWRVVIRLYSASHSIRQKVLNTWNARSNWIKLHAIGGTNNREFRLEITLQKGVPIEAVWWTSWGMARQFVAALNIGTFGYFWWYLPKQTDKFYEKIEDIEKADFNLVIKRNPNLELDWGNGRALTQQDLYNTSICFGGMPSPAQTDKHEPYGYYISGLTLLGVNDVHNRMDTNIFGNFYLALKSAMRIFDGVNSDTQFAQRFEEFTTGILQSPEDRKQLYEIGEALVQHSKLGHKVTINEAMGMKILCDAYFLKVLRGVADERMRAEKTTLETAPEA